MSKYRVNTYFFSKQIAEAEDPNRDTSRDFVIEDGKLVKYIGPGGDVTVPDTVHTIGNGAFAYSLLLTSIRMPDSVTELGVGIFQGCSSLRSVHIPSHLLEGMSSMRAMYIFSEDVMKHAYLEGNFIREILAGTEDFSEGFRNLFIRKLCDPFYAVRWLYTCIREDHPDWAQKILDLYENRPPLKLDSCIEEAAAQGRAEIVTRLLRYQQTHPEHSEWELSLDME